MTKRKITIAAVGITLVVLTAIVALLWTQCGTRGHDKREKQGNYWVIDHPTPNITPGRNRVQGVVLHHTATFRIQDALGGLCSPKRQVSCHSLIDRDGTRYILASPDKITHHAGNSMLDGKAWCNKFTIGIECQGNTCNRPLTEAQINSAIDYLLPIISKYGIPINKIVTHQQVRDNWLSAHPDRKDVPAKVDITPAEHQRFIQALKARLQADK